MTQALSVGSVMLVVGQGFAVSLGLIVAIGAQNAFVLRQGLRREHVGAVVAFCAMADAILVVAGVMGLGQAMGDQPVLTQGLALFGAIFLSVYGWRAWRRVFMTQGLQAAPGEPPLRLRAVLWQAAAFTLLNPHVYLDTVLLVGSMGAQQPQALRGWFALGASSASVMWFVALGYGARWLAPVFSRPRAWQVLDALIGCMMWGLAVMLWRSVGGG